MPSLPRLSRRRACTMDCTSGAVKGREGAVTCVLHDTTPEPRYDPTSLRIVTIEDVMPQVVTGLSGHLRRLDDVREEHRRQYPIDVAVCGRRTGEKFLHRVERRGPLAGVPPTMHFASQLDELCVPERGGQSTTTGNAHDRIVDAVYDERRRRNRWQYGPGVDGQIRSHDLDDETWRRTSTFVSSKLFEDLRSGWRMDEGSQKLARSPVAFDIAEKSRHVEIGACWVVPREQASEGSVEYETLNSLWKGRREE